MVLITNTAVINANAPVITLIGSNPIFVTLGASFIDPGATVTDPVDAPKTITGAGSVNTAVAGTYTLTYTATDNFANQAVPVERSVVVGVANQSIAPWTTIANQTYGVAPFTITPPTASSGLPVAVTIKSGPATINGNTVTLTGTGTVVLAADQIGNANYNAASEVTTIFTVSSPTISRASNTITFPTITGGVVGGSATLTATASSGLQVSYSSTSSNISISNNVVSYLAAGPASIIASQAGNSNYLAATSVTNSFTVAQGAATIISVPTASSISYPQALSNSVLSGGSGNVPGSFSWTTPGTVPPVGTNTQGVTFTPSDTANYASVSTNIMVVVNKGTATVTLGNLSQNYDGTTKSVSVTTAPTNLTVSVTYNGSTNLPVNAGSYPVAGTVVSTNYSGVGTNTLTIAKASNTITFPTITGAVVGGSATLTATTSSSLAVTYSTTSTNITISNNVVSYLAAGPASIIASQAGNSNYLAATSVTNSFTVAQGAATIISVPTASSISYPQALSNSVLSGGSGNVPGSFSWTTPGTVPPVGTNTQGVTFTPSDTANYASVSTNIMVVVNKGTATVTLGNLSQNYDGTTKSVSVTTAPTNLTVSVTYNGSTNLPVNAGSYPVVGTVVSTNYSGVGSNTLTIAPASNTITFPAITGGVVGGSTTLTATSSSTLAVSYSSPSTNVSISNNVVTYLGAGPASIVASQNGNSNYLAAIPVTNSFVVAQGSSSITTAPTAGAISYGQALSNSVLSGGSANVPGSFSWTTPGMVPPVGTNTASVTFTPSDTVNYSSVSTNISVVVAQASATVSFGNLSQVYSGSPESVTVTTVPANLNVGVTYNGSSNAPVNAGSYAVVASVNDTNYSGSASNTLTIAKASNAITFPAVGGGAVGGSATLTATASSGLQVSYSSTSSNISISNNVVSYLAAGPASIIASQAGNSNYLAATSVTNSFTVTSATNATNTPSWTSPVGQRYSAVVYAQVVDASGNALTNAASMLGAFSGTNCAGVCSPSSGPDAKNLFQLTVYANETPVSGMSYKFFNGATGQISTLAESYNFANGAITGSIVSPITLHLIKTQTIPVYAGWTWISFNVLPADNTWGTLLSNYQGADNDVIIGAGGSATYYGGHWYPSSPDFTPQAGVMYLISSGTATNVTATGYPAPTPVNFSLVNGWNWLGCPDASATTLTAMLSGVSFNNNDLIISQTGQSATYYGGIWYTSTGSSAFPMAPGTGYLLYINGRAQTVTLQ